MLYLADLEFINSRVSSIGELRESDIIKYILEDDNLNPQKAFMAKGENYYNAQHDSLLKEYNAAEISETERNDGYEKEVKRKFVNPNRSNHHNINPFHKLLVDQKVSYIVGKEPTITVEGAENSTDLKAYEELLTNAADEIFNTVLQDLVRGASNKGYEVLHIYYDDELNLKYCIIPATEVIPIYDNTFQNNLEQVIRYYAIKVMKNGREHLRRKVEWWTKDTVTYYVEKDDNLFVLDPAYNVNPMPHWWDISLINGAERKRTAHAWGKVPFVILDNNKNRISDLNTIKSLIDAYDMISSEGTNTLLDLVDLYWVIQGYGGETAGAIAKKLQINKAVNISDPTGKIEAKQVTLPVAERIEYLRMLRHDIYHFGMGIDIEDERFGNAPSGVALKFRYANLRHKCENIAPRLKTAIKEFFWFITEDYNRKNGTNYSSDVIKITLNYSQISNDTEMITLINQSEGIISRKTQLENHPLVTDVNEELKQLELEEKKAQEAYSHLEMNPPGSDVNE